MRSRQCGVVFQSYALFPHMNVCANVAYPLRVRDVEPRERARRADAMLELVGLAGFSATGCRASSPAASSSGWRSPGRSCSSPRALLLDEPLSALDAATRRPMRDEIRRIQKRQNIASLLITHDQDEALSLADRIAVLRDGRLVQVATPQEIYDRPADGFVAGFVGRANLIDGEVVAARRRGHAAGRLAVPAQPRPPGTRVRLLRAPGARRARAARRRREHVRGDGRRTTASSAPTARSSSRSGGGSLKIETTVRGPIAHVHVPREAVQFLSNP